MWSWLCPSPLPWWAGWFGCSQWASRNHLYTQVLSSWFRLRYKDIDHPFTCSSIYFFPTKWLLSQAWWPHSRSRLAHTSNKKKHYICIGWWDQSTMLYIRYSKATLTSTSYSSTTSDNTGRHKSYIGTHTHTHARRERESKPIRREDQRYMN